MNAFRLILALILCLPLLAQEPRFAPYEMLWKFEGGTVFADLSFLLDAPAGRDGFITIRDGRLADGAGRRFRLWGVNFSFTANLPDKQNAPLVAAHLARFGINSVRVHHLDWRTPRGIIDSAHPDSRHLHPEMLDRLHFLIAELKKRGIYTNLNLNVARAFQVDDGVKDADQLGFAKGVTYFDERMIELQQEYARQLLEPVNPYTGLALKDDPAIAIVEILNENSLVESWVRGRTLGQGPNPEAADRTFSGLPASYARDLDNLYQTWLAEALTAEELARLREEAGVDAKTAVPRLGPDELPKAAEFRFHTEARFYIEIESRFFARMKKFLRDDLGVRPLLVGTSAYSGSLTPYPLLTSASQLEITDAHFYWQHPSYFIDPETKRRGFRIRNTPMVDEPAKSSIVALQRAAIAGQPFIVSEVNHPYPNEYAAEALPLLAAYGAFHDWDGVYWYSFEHSGAANWIPKYPGHFDSRQDPVKMSQLALGALIFLRGDVNTAKRTIRRDYTAAQVRESLRLPAAAHAPYFTPGFPADLPLVHSTRIGSLTAQRPSRSWPRIRTPYESDTRQLRWELDNSKGLVSINTPRAQGLAGHLAKGRPRLSDVTVVAKTPFGAVMVASLDGKPIAESSRLLITAGARTHNAGMKWNDDRTSLVETGGPPMLIEVLEGELQIRLKGSPKRTEVLPLDGAGRALGPFVAPQKTLTGIRFNLGEHDTPWYFVSIER
ncbi:MAG: hypothetical protein KJZ84_13130 [Bryobacteraceae bacterium]|nr:hypothetical protein [Bryobacteraceae bacterium]